MVTTLTFDHHAGRARHGVVSPAYASGNWRGNRGNLCGTAGLTTETSGFPTIATAAVKPQTMKWAAQHLARRMT